MTPIERATRYRDCAAECVFLAQRQDAIEERALIVMARAWVALAELVERNES